MKSIQQKSNPSSGGGIPSHKLVNGENVENTAGHYRQNSNQTPIAGDGHVTVRPSSKQVNRVQRNQNNDTSSRKKASWGN